jgi:ubiquinone/menaquinone biosynthesis C-methylase UbiE
MSQLSSPTVPYFEHLFADLPQADPPLRALLSRHAHWAYWEQPTAAVPILENFAAAQESLCAQVAAAGDIQSGNRVLDCGCGFGGTIAHLNQHWSALDLVGLNIDPRQIEFARTQVQPQAPNQIEFVTADACALPFPDQSFDRVLALECIFHFPSRERFFAEAQRVLKPGGTLALCDFVPHAVTLLLDRLVKPWVKTTLESDFGPVNYAYDLPQYRRLAQNSGFSPLQERNITAQVLPTYPMAANVLNQNGGVWRSQQASLLPHRLMQLGLVRYMILAYRKP